MSASRSPTPALDAWRRELKAGKRTATPKTQTVRTE